MTQCTAMTRKHFEGRAIIGGGGRLSFHKGSRGGGGAIIGGGRLVEVLRYAWLSHVDVALLFSSRRCPVRASIGQSDGNFVQTSAGSVSSNQISLRLSQLEQDGMYRRWWKSAKLGALLDQTTL